MFWHWSVRIIASYGECPVITLLELTTTQGLGCGQSCFSGCIVFISEHQGIQALVCGCRQFSFSVIAYGYRDGVALAAVSHSLKFLCRYILHYFIIVGSRLAVSDLLEAYGSICRIGCCIGIASVYRFSILIHFRDGEAELAFF